MRSKLAQIIEPPSILLYGLITLHQIDELSVLAVLRVPREELLQENSEKLYPHDLLDVSA